MKFDLVAAPKLADQRGHLSDSQNKVKRSKGVAGKRLRPGDQVALRPPEQILATLDAYGALEGLPFMPEMLQFCGKVFTVAKRAEKICDTICPVGSRRMESCVYLEGLRCDGAAHGGCQAECRIYWKEEWLTRLPTGTAAPEPDAASVAHLRATLQAQVRQPDQPEMFRCQATEARRATTALPDLDLRQYVREITSGNVSSAQLLRVALRAVPYELRRLVYSAMPSHLRPFARRVLALLRGAQPGSRPRPAPLNLEPGDWVEVRSAAEIRATLNVRGADRGLSFSAPEMLPACSKRFRVRRRVTRIIDEATGRMLSMKHDCIVLEGFVCTGHRSAGRWLCGREIYPYWREAWLKRVPNPASDPYRSPSDPPDTGCR